MSPFCLGSVEDQETVEAAFDHGINFFFLSADLHWPMYEATRRGIRALLRRGSGVRDQIVVAATSYVTQREFTRAPFRELLAAMPKLDRIDVVVIGGAYGHEFPVRQAIYSEFVERGDFGARATGTTFHDRAAALAAINQAQIDIAFVRYNPLHVGARYDLFPELRPSHTKIFSFKSTTGYIEPQMLSGVGITKRHWRPAITDYYRFALSQPEIDGLLCAPSLPREVRALNRALRLPPLRAREQQYMIDLAQLTAGIGGAPRGSRPPLGRRGS